MKVIRMIKRFFVCPEFDEQMARIQDEQDRTVLDTRVVRRELLAIREVLDDGPVPTLGEHRAVLQ